jgi:hypothetical protein
MEGLGQSHNYVHIGDSVICDMKNYSGATIYAYESSAEAVISLKQRLNGGSPAALGNVIDHYYTSDGAGGAWSKQTQTADDEVTKSSAAAQSLCAIEFDQSMFSANYNQLEVEVDGSCVVSVVLHGLKVQRTPENLPAVKS